MKISYVLAAPLLMSLCVMPLSASDRDHDRDHKGEHNSSQHVRHMDRDHDRDRNQHWRAEQNRYQASREARERRERAEWRRHHESVHDRDAFHQPAGVDHGRKKGWQGRDLSPGQAKKADNDRDHGR